ncbi:MAG: polyprenyl diphosphate synthase [Candidatus Woesearchaeota archaeon]
MSEINHVGIILDGNRRFAKRLMLNPFKGHEWGAKKFRKFMRWCEEIGIKEVTAFAFSLENFNRPKAEFEYLMNIFEKEFKALVNEPEVYEKKLKIRFIGRIEMFPPKVYNVMKELMEKTKYHDKFLLNFAMAYGGRAEITDAAKKIVNEVKEGKLSVDDINPEMFKDYLYLKSEPELIIRTSGEMRSSGFLLYQGDYSEWFFVNKFWPEFEKEDLLKCIDEFKSRGRRFGK